jgi:hypothetical protein
MFDGAVEVLHFQCGGAAVRARVSAGIAGEGEGVGAEFVFDPVAVLGIPHGGGFQAEEAFVKRAGAFDVGDGVNTESEFNNVDSCL